MSPPPPPHESDPSAPGRILLHDASPATLRAEELLQRLPAKDRDALATAAQAAASAQGLRFVREAGPRDIPLVLSPAALPRDQLAHLGKAARLVTSALVKVARHIIDARPERARLLFAHLSPLELEALATRSREAEELLLARVDWFVDTEGRLSALEVNATIPAMPVYSDAAVRGWLSAVSKDSAEELAQRNGSNAQWLVDSMLRAARAAGRGGADFPRGLEVQLLHRPGDPQISELSSLAALLRARGAQARTCTPLDVVLDGNPARMIYRHLFARYVEPATALGAAFLDPARHGMWNRVAGWLEVKGLFAELSLAAATQPELFDEAEQRALRAHVPWTRLLDDVLDSELPNPEALVLKRSFDYGGKSVVVGRDSGAAAFRTALAAARRDPPGSWVTQRLVDSRARERWLCSAGAEGVTARRLALHLDVSTYASLLPGTPDGGSVCRAAPGSVVNIVGGGGVAPLFAEDVLAAALPA